MSATYKSELDPHQQNPIHKTQLKWCRGEQQDGSNRTGFQSSLILNYLAHWNRDIKVNYPYFTPAKPYKHRGTSYHNPPTPDNATRWATKLEDSLADLPYKSRLKELGIYSLYCQRQLGDFIEIRDI